MADRRDRDEAGRPRSARPRDAYGRPLPYGAEDIPRIPDDYAPTAEEALAEARRLISEERPFHAHEVLEARWKTGPDDERELWQGLAQIAVGLTHIQRGNPKGARSLLLRGAERVAPFGTRRPYDIRVDDLVRRARGLAERIEKGGTENLGVPRLI